MVPDWTVIPLCIWCLKDPVHFKKFSFCWCSFVPELYFRFKEKIWANKFGLFGWPEFLVKSEHIKILSFSRGKWPVFLVKWKSTQKYSSISWKNMARFFSSNCNIQNLLPNRIAKTTFSFQDFWPILGRSGSEAQMRLGSGQHFSLFLLFFGNPDYGKARILIENWNQIFSFLCILRSLCM